MDLSMGDQVTNLGQECKEEQFSNGAVAQMVSAVVWKTTYLDSTASVPTNFKMSVCQSGYWDGFIRRFWIVRFNQPTPKISSSAFWNSFWMEGAMLWACSFFPKEKPCNAARQKALQCLRRCSSSASLTRVICKRGCLHPTLGTRKYNSISRIVHSVTGKHNGSKTQGVGSIPTGSRCFSIFQRWGFV